jgi:YegS/Rv2252/BmrU family lipid kinase
MASPRPLFVVNPAAGHGKALRAMDQIGAALPGGAEVVLARGPGDAETQAFQAAAQGFGPVVAVGGDGTVLEVVNGLMRVPLPPPLCIVAAGSGNDAARSLGLPRDPVAAARLAWSERAGVVDLGLCNERYFLNVAGVGLDTVVAAAVNVQTGRFAQGKAGYIVQALRELRRFENPPFTIHLDDQVIETPSILLAVANMRYFGGGMRIAPQADPTDGLLDLWIGGDLSRKEALILFPAIFAGQHGRHPRVRHHRVTSVRIESPWPLQVQLDGEILDVLPAEFRVVPQALRIVGWPTAASG